MGPINLDVINKDKLGESLKDWQRCYQGQIGVEKWIADPPEVLFF
jgi:hypothetical protein